MSKIDAGTWVEIHNLVLRPEDRPNRLPEDTKKVPYEMRTRGFLLQEAMVNEEVTIQTLAGRVISGKLLQVNPSYEHTYGPPVYELMHIGAEEKKLLEQSK